MSRAPTILVHGGAGSWSDEKLAPAVEGCQEAAVEAAKVLDQGALAAVVVAVKTLENNPAFNAGLGASPTRDGTIELDASVMTGDLRFGAVGACPPVASAVEAALKVYEDGEHLLLVGEAAREFAVSRGVGPLTDADLLTEQALKNLEKRRSEERVETGSNTVGAVAVDASGNLAAATSTGGILYKRRGRVGDTPVPGAGTYADADAGAAASATGLGEAILRVLLCQRAVLDSAVVGVIKAGNAGLELLERRGGGQGGLAMLDRDGNMFAGANTKAMPWAKASPDSLDESGF